jgi:hypothetical protein
MEWNPVKVSGKSYLDLLPGDPRVQVTLYLQGTVDPEWQGFIRVSVPYSRVEQYPLDGGSLTFVTTDDNLEAALHALKEAIGDANRLFETEAIPRREERENQKRTDAGDTLERRANLERRVAEFDW